MHPEQFIYFCYHKTCNLPANKWTVWIELFTCEGVGFTLSFVLEFGIG